MCHCHQEKQNFFRSSSLKNKHVSIGGRLSITPPHTQPETVDFVALLAKLTSSMDQFRIGLNDLDQSDMTDGLESQLRVTRQLVICK